MTLRHYCAISVGLLLSFGCSVSTNNGSSSTVSSCASTSMSQCTEQDVTLSSCSSFGGDYVLSNAACKTDNRVGTCTYTASGRTIRLRMYSDGGTPFTNTSAQAACTMLGAGASYTSG